MKKRIKTLLLVFCIMVCFMPAVIASGESVAQIGDTEYKTLADAVKDANNATEAVTIELLKDAELSTGITIKNTNGKEITINGNSHKIVPTANTTFTGLIVTVRTNLTIIDTAFSGFVTSKDVINAYKGADLVLTGCTLADNQSRSVIRLQSGYANTVSISDTSFKGNNASEGIIYCGDGTGKFALTDCIVENNTAGNAAAPVALPGTVSITDCTFSKNTTDTTWSYAASAAYCWGEDVAITGNTVVGNTVEATGSSAAAAIIVKTGGKTIDLSGNNIDETNVVKTRNTTSDSMTEVADAAVFVRNSGSGTVTIASGTIAGTIDSNNGKGISITGGTFTDDPSAYVKDTVSAAGVTAGSDVVYAVGEAKIEEIFEEALNSGKSVSVEITKGDMKLTDVPDGVEIIVSEGASATINGIELPSGKIDGTVVTVDMLDEKDKTYNDDHVYSGADSVVLKSNDSIANFEEARLFVNGKPIDSVSLNNPAGEGVYKSKYMTVTHGSIKVTIDEAAMTENGSGTYKLEIESLWGMAEGTYVYNAPKTAITDLPQTGDNSQLLFFAALLTLSGAGLMVCRRKREN